MTLIDGAVMAVTKVLYTLPPVLASSSTSENILKMIIVVNQGPVVQSVVSLTSSLRVISLTVLADSIHTILKCLAEKM